MKALIAKMKASRAMVDASVHGAGSTMGAISNRLFCL